MADRGVKDDNNEAGVYNDVDPVVFGARGGVVEVQTIKENLCASCGSGRRTEKLPGVGELGNRCRGSAARIKRTGGSEGSYVHENEKGRKGRCRATLSETMTNSGVLRRCCELERGAALRPKMGKRGGDERG